MTAICEDSRLIHYDHLPGSWGPEGPWSVEDIEKAKAPLLSKLERSSRDARKTEIRRVGKLTIEEIASSVMLVTMLVASQMDEGVHGKTGSNDGL